MADSEQRQPSEGSGGEAANGAGAKDEAAAARAANRFDIRRIIGGLFTLYGVIMLVAGLVGSHHVKTKAAGINIDLLAGICMLIFAACMLAWAFLRPIMQEPPETRGQGSGRIRRAPAT